MVNQVTTASFDPSELPAGRVPVMFAADWCGFCARFMPFFKSRFQQGYVVDVSNEEDPAWDTYNIDLVPTVVVFEDGKPVKRWSGVLSEGHAEDMKTIVHG